MRANQIAYGDFVSFIAGAGDAYRQHRHSYVSAAGISGIDSRDYGEIGAVDRRSISGFFVRVSTKRRARNVHFDLRDQSGDLDRTGPIAAVSDDLRHNRGARERRAPAAALRSARTRSTP